MTKYLFGKKIIFHCHGSEMEKFYLSSPKMVKKMMSEFFNRADVIIWNYVPPTPLNSNNFFGHFIYGILERPIITVLQNGKVLMNDYRLIGIDENEINNYVYSQGKRLYNAMK